MKTVLRKLGLAGFLFFFIKGLLWLTVPAAVVAFRGCGAEPDTAKASPEPPTAASAAQTSEVER